MNPDDKKCETYWKAQDKNAWSSHTNPSECVKAGFNCLKELVTNSPQAFEVDKNAAVFWCGDVHNNMDEAQKWAENQNPKKYTLEQTPGGSIVNGMKLFSDNKNCWGCDTGKQAAEIFDVASKYFAEKASGTVSVFAHDCTVNGNFGRRTWFRIEAPALAQNQQLSKVEFYKSNGHGTWTHETTIDKTRAQLANEIANKIDFTY